MQRRTKVPQSDLSWAENRKGLSFEWRLEESIVFSPMVMERKRVLD